MVYKLDNTLETVSINSVDCEVKYCYLADSTDTIKLALWESHIDLIENNTSYKFTDLATRLYQGEKHLTTTRNTVITALATPVPFNAPSTTSIDGT